MGNFNFYKTKIIGEVSENIKSSQVIAFDVDELDITNLPMVKAKLNYLKPHVEI